jgi:RNA polymerase-binding transcription factor DksA
MMDHNTAMRENLELKAKLRRTRDDGTCQDCGDEVETRRLRCKDCGLLVCT